MSASAWPFAYGTVIAGSVASAWYAAHRIGPLGAGSIEAIWTELLVMLVLPPACGLIGALVVRQLRAGPALAAVPAVVLAAVVARDWWAEANLDINEATKFALTVTIGAYVLGTGLILPFMGALAQLSRRVRELTRVRSEGQAV